MSVALIPIFILPGFSFYFDVVPRLWFLLGVVASFLVLRRDLFHDLRRVYETPHGRWFCRLAGLQVIALIAATALSSSIWLSVNGGTWRRFGLIAQLALLLLTLQLTSVLMGSRGLLTRLLVYIASTGCLASAYGILQYFGIDPLLDSSLYHFGEGIFMIVRPPGPLGHADYFAVYLILVLFSGIALLGSWRTLGVCTIALSGSALVLTGTRAALVGVAAGLLTTLLKRRPTLRLQHAGIALAMSLAMAGFYFSPFGTKLRARVHWSLDDKQGGARLLLWRDSIAEGLAHPLFGSGPETFPMEFPHFQSVELSRAYPDFYHESPHNILLDVMNAQGIFGLIASAGLLVTAFQASRAASNEDRTLAAVLGGCLVGLVVSQMFFSYTIATALCTYVTMAALISLASTQTQPGASRMTAVSVLLAGLLLIYAARFAVGDRYLAIVRDKLASLDVAGAEAAYGESQKWMPSGASADLYYSRSMSAAATRVRDPLSAVRASQQAVAAATRAVYTSDEPANAAYNLAALNASRNAMAETETSLRTAVSASPNWFKPHWMLARVLALQGRLEEAEREAEMAVERNGNHDAEVAQTLQQIKAKRR